MDHMMPDIDGIEATRRIRDLGTEYARNIPIIAFTANAIVGNEQMFLNAGFQDFISKPIDIDRLDTIIHRWVKDKGREPADTLTPMEPPPKGQPPDISGRPDLHNWHDWQIEGLDIPECIDHFGGDEELFLHVLHSFIDNTPSLIGKAKKVCGDNLNEYIITIHGIKGSCRTICAHELAKRAEDLEKAAKSADLDFIRNNNDAYLNNVEKFIADIWKIWRDR